MEQRLQSQSCGCFCHLLRTFVMWCPRCSSTVFIVVRREVCNVEYMYLLYLCVCMSTYIGQLTLW